MKVIIHHAEIGLKKGNFDLFERRLLENIRTSLKKGKISVKNIKRLEKRIILEAEGDKEKIRETLKKTFGISYFSFVEELERDVKKLEKRVESIMKEMKVKEISFKTKRSDKNFEPNSVELNKRLGEIASNLGIKVDYSNSKNIIFTEITGKNFWVYTEKIIGPGGLPVGTGGKVLCLLSGGIDSPVAAWLLMKRGCSVDFLHFHTFRTNKEASKTKITKLVETLNKYQNNSKLYLVPYHEYEILSQGRIGERYDLITFKHYMLKFAEKLADEKKYDAIVTGDNLGQVASQTIENLKSSSINIKALLFRPLITYDKQEIIDIAEKIDTYNTSIEEYKDCCSIVSKNPLTKTNSDKFERELEHLDLSSIIDETSKNIETFEIK